MNKKFFSILVIIITLSLIGVSCSKTPTEPTTDQSTTTEPTTPDEPTTPEEPTDPNKLDLYVSGAGEKNNPIDIQIRVYGDYKLMHSHTSINSIGLAGKHKDLDGLIFKVTKIEDDTTVAGHKPSPEAISKIEDHTKIEVDENKNIIFHEGLLVDGIFYYFEPVFSYGVNMLGSKLTIEVSKEGYNPTVLTVYVLSDIRYF
ncbi:hypothetical protein [Brachyspira pulli]|uniref:hypothetical protein n=1 Tax=Brachyspira pulli TaxID=310721 RepID=UPI0030045FE0